MQDVNQQVYYFKHVDHANLDGIESVSAIPNRKQIADPSALDQQNPFFFSISLFLDQTLSSDHSLESS